QLLAWDLPWPKPPKNNPTCRNKNGSVNEKCESRQFPLVEKQMAAALKKALSKATDKKALETDQAQWKSWMEDLCNDASFSYFNGNSGSEFPMMECEANLTRVRTVQLNE
ncbi:MAG: DUF1311 domain-containing protein, partial [Burkholderiales bacterium]|nr:DUF1311 domain-containing protein [Burkholderiales bacterium]